MVISNSILFLVAQSGFVGAKSNFTPHKSRLVCIQFAPRSGFELNATIAYFITPFQVRLGHNCRLCGGTVG